MTSEWDAPPPKTSILLVDDHEIVRLGTRAALQTLPGIEVVAEVEDGEAALRACRDLKPDLAIVDLHMPGMDGIAITTRLSEPGIGTRVIVFTSATSASEAERSLAAGAWGYAVKSARAATLRSAVQAVTSGQRYVDPVIAADLMAPTGRPLSPREHEILQLMSVGKQNAEIAQELSISTETVKAHVSNVLTKLEAYSRTHAVALALRSAIIQ